MDREGLVSRMIELRNEEREIRRKLDKMDFDDRHKISEKYLGKFYIDPRDGNNYVRCLHVFGIDPETAGLRSMCLSYWPGNEKTSFGIEYYGHFKPWDDESSFFNWREIGKDEYLKHYLQVQRIIKKNTP